MKTRIMFAALSFVVSVSLEAQVMIGTGVTNATLDNNTAGQAEAFQGTASQTGVITSCSFYLDTSNRAKTVYIGLYSNSGGHPKTLLGSASISSPTPGQWITLAISSTPNVISGTSYHIALLGTGGTLGYRDVNGGTHSETSTQSSLSSLPPTWSSGQSWASGPLSSYCSGTTSGSGGGSAVSIAISPTAVAVNQGATQQFSAHVSGSANTSVNWSLTGIGSLSSSGLYTAPNTQGSATIKAQSLADTTKSATSTVTIPPVGISIAPTSATVQPTGTQQFSASVTGTTNASVSWHETGNGAVSSSGVYSAPNTSESDTVTVTSLANTAVSATASVTVQPQSAGQCGRTLNWTSSVCQQIAQGQLNTAMVHGVNDPSAWTVISRHGEYGQNETECNLPSAVSMVNNSLVITTSAVSRSCGDFNVDGSVRNASASWPYATGDVQLNTFNFTYGTVLYNVSVPSSATNLWPGWLWMLTTACQTTNKYSGDTGFSGCPNVGQSGYTEIDPFECYGNDGWCQFHVANPGFGIGNGCDVSIPISDSNFHTVMLIWTPTSIKQYTDGELKTTCNQSMSNPMFLIVQTQTGGAGGTPNNSLLPATTAMKYIKVCSTTDGSCATVPDRDPSVEFVDRFGGPAQ